MNTVFADKEKAIENLQSFADSIKEQGFVLRIDYGRGQSEYVLRPASQIIDKSADCIVAHVHPRKRGTTKRIQPEATPVKREIDLFRMKLYEKN